MRSWYYCSNGSVTRLGWDDSSCVVTGLVIVMSIECIERRFKLFKGHPGIDRRQIDGVDSVIVTSKILCCCLFKHIRVSVSLEFLFQRAVSVVFHDCRSSFPLFIAVGLWNMLSAKTKDINYAERMTFTCKCSSKFSSICWKDRRE